MPSERTMLFTDIEGSTALAQSCGVLWPAVLATHGRLLVDAIDAHGGDIERTEGDSFFATFADAGDAVAAAVAAQRALAANSWPQPVRALRVRMGLHTGPIDPTDRYYVGVEIHRAARIMAAAYGGQILASETTRQAAVGDADFEDVGTHRLKDFADPIALFHVRYDGGPGALAFPPPRTLGTGAALDLLDRDEELEELNAAVRQLATTQRGGAVLIQGPPGIGKTSLVDAAVGRAEAAGLRVLRARGTELESALAFGAVRELLAPAVLRLSKDERETVFDGPAQLARPVLGLETSGLGEGDPLFGLFWLTVALAERSPLLLAIDDLHWLDEESTRFVAYLAQRVEGLPILLLASARPAEPGTGESVGVVAESADVIRPRPLSADAVARLVRDRAAQDVLRVTGGNPLLAVELARAVADSGPEVALEEIGPRSVGRAVLRRVAKVSEVAVALSRAVAISPDPLPLTDLAELAGLAVDDARSAADALVRVEVLADDAGRLVFLHPVMRTAVYEELDPYQRRQAHTRAARLLLERGADVERIATHLLAGEAAGEPENVSVLRAAADLAVQRYAPRAACRYLERALEEPAPPEDLAEIGLELGRLQHSLGRPEAADSLRRAFVAATEPMLRVDLAVELGDTLVDDHRLEEALSLLESVRAESTADPERQLLVDSAICLVAMEMEADAAELEGYTARIPRDLAGETRAEGRALCVAAQAMLIAGEPVGRCREILRRVLRATDVDSLAITDVNLLMRALSQSGQIDDASWLAERLLARARRSGEERVYVVAQYQVAVGMNQRGQLRECEAALRLGLESPGLQQSWRLLFDDWLLTTLSMQGRFDEAQELLIDLAARDDTLTTGTLARRWMELALDRGDHEAALAAAIEAYEWADGRVVLTDVGSDYALVLAGLGRAAEAVTVARANLDRAIGIGNVQSIGVAQHALGVALADQEGLEHLERAVEMLAASPYRWNQANAEVDLGRLLIDLGHPDRARDVLMSALEYAVEHGAVPIEKRTREQLTRAGVTVLEPAAVGARLLSATEERIARLAASGLSDTEIAQRLFITTRTVEAHLRQTLEKLRIESREDLPDALAMTSVP